jgi:hypothetical protein
MTGPKAQEKFFRLSEPKVSLRDVYRLMTPIFGKGIAVPGSMKSAAVAEAFSLAFLERHLELRAGTPAVALPGIGLRVQSVMHVHRIDSRRRQRIAQLAKSVQQGMGIRPAAERNAVAIHRRQPRQRLGQTRR